ncbi:MAG: ABC transporter permease [Planctomycetota bacterium]
MSLLQIAWRNFCHRSLSSILTTISLALGVGLVVLVLSIYGVISEAFTRNASVGYNLVVGPKGSPLQLTLNSVFYLSQPIENIPYTYYMEFLPQSRRASLVERYGGDPELATRPGKYAASVEGGYAIPLALGDYYDQYRVVGTIPEFFEVLRHGPNVDQPFTFEDGRPFETSSEEHGFFEAVLGSRVAKEMQVGVGDVIFLSHGNPDGKGHADGFTIVGVMNPTGTPNDRAAFVNMEGFYLMEGHAKPINEEQRARIEKDGNESNKAPDEGESGESSESATNGEPEETGDPEEGTDSDEDADTMIDLNATDLSGQNAEPAVLTVSIQSPVGTDSDSDARSQASEEEFVPLTIPEREVTAILVRNGNPFFAPGMQNAINEGIQAQAAAPVGEISKLMSVIVGPLLTALLIVTLITCFVAAVGVLVAIYNSMNDRRRDIAVMRALGARRQTVTTVIVIESLLVATIGAIVGWVLAHSAITLYAGTIEEQTGVQVGFFSTSSYEVLILPLVLCLSAIAAMLPALSAYRTDVASNLQK